MIKEEINRGSRSERRKETRVRSGETEKRWYLQPKGVCIS